MNENLGFLLYGFGTIVGSGYAIGLVLETLVWAGRNIRRRGEVIM